MRTKKVTLGVGLAAPFLFPFFFFFVFSTHVAPRSSLSAAAGASLIHRVLSVASPSFPVASLMVPPQPCKASPPPPTSTRARAERTHTETHAPARACASVSPSVPPCPPSPPSCSHRPGQAKHIKCASVVAAGLMNNAQKQKSRPSFYYLILLRGGWEGGDARMQGGWEGV